MVCLFSAEYERVASIGSTFVPPTLQNDFRVLLSVGRCQTTGNRSHLGHDDTANNLASSPSSQALDEVDCAGSTYAVAGPRSCVARLTPLVGLQCQQESTVVRVTKRRRSLIACVEQNSRGQCRSGSNNRS